MAASPVSLFILLIILSRRDKAFLWILKKISQELFESVKFGLSYDIRVEKNILEALVNIR